MSTRALALKYRRARPQPAGVGFQDPPYTISAIVRVRAEIRRLFQAVVVPEYIETWLRVPEQQASWAVAPLQQSPGFSLDWCNATATQSRILAVYKTCRRRRLMICWKVEQNQVLKESTVILRLSGDFESSILSLFHTGFGTFDDFAWHRQFWSASLERLVRLF